MRVPKYRKNGDGRGFVEVNKRRHYLGKFGSAEGEKLYRQFVSRLLANGTVPQRPNDRRILVLVNQFLDWADARYGDSGESYTCEWALKPLLDLYGSEFAGSFTPAHLETIQKHLISRKLARTSINTAVAKIRLFFKWAVRNGFVDPSVHQAILTVDGLRRGKTEAREPEPTGAVPREHVLALLPFLPPPVAALAQVQYYCGMRPGEVTLLRRCDIDTTGDVWLYRPHAHKNDWRGQDLVKAIPKLAQVVIAGFFKPGLEEYLFSPVDSAAWYRRQPRRERTTKQYPSELVQMEKRRKRRGRTKPRRSPGDHYNTDSYRRAVVYGLKRAKKAGVEIPHWHPHQLRHSVATFIAAEFGQQSAQRWLGHSRLDSTSIYTEKEVSELIAIARRLDAAWAG